MITPGVYADLSNSDYHAADGYLSASQLKMFLPEHFKPFTSGDRSALDFGTAFHTHVLGVGEPFAVVAAASWRGKAAMDARSVAYQMGETPVLADDVPRLDAMRDAVLAHPVAADLVTGQDRMVEHSWFTETGMQARPDVWLPGTGTIVDIKTTSAKPGADNLARAVIDYGYDMQAVHYMEVGRELGLPVGRFVFVFVGKDTPHYVSVVELDESFIDRGTALRCLAIERATDVFGGGTPEYEGSDNMLSVSCPRWARL